MTRPNPAHSGLRGLNTVYALVDEAGRITGCDPLFPEWVLGGVDPPPGSLLADILPEFVGQEEFLAEVRRGERPFVRIEHSARVYANGQMHYLTFTVVAAEPDSGAALVVLATDVTEVGRYLQELTQNRNELRLTRRKLAQLTHQLDYLLRHYVPAGVADALLTGELQPDLGGEVRSVTVLFADARGSTPLAEQLAPDVFMQLLNKYLNVMADAINEYDGTISQFQGDNVLAIFNAPRQQPDHALRAVQVGVRLQQAVAHFQAQQSPHQPRLNFGVGINTGPALVGNVGAQWRYSYTAIGDSVNLAARITGAVPPGQVWISQATRAHLPDTVVLKPLPEITFKGKSHATPLFEVIKTPS